MSGVVLLALLIFAAALLYSSVGHAGASGYLAAMALVAAPVAVMRPTALVLNVLVATIASVQFLRARCFSWPVFWPFAVASVPCAFAGGAVTLGSGVYKPLVGLVLVYAAWRLAREAARPAAQTHRPPLAAALVVGAVIGLLSGLVGVGGGIFLSPLLLFMGWAETRETSGVSALFILVNSIAGLGGQLSSLGMLPSETPALALAAFVGGTVGSTYGARRLSTPTLRRLLAAVLVVAGAKMLFVP